MKKNNWELVKSVRLALEQIAVKSYDETNLKLKVMDALDQVLEDEREGAQDDDKANG